MLTLGIDGTPVDVDEEVAGDAQGEEVDRGSGDDLVGPEMDREERMDERERTPACHRDHDAQRPRVRLVGAPETEEGTHQHHPLEPDVHDAAALGEHPADRRKRQRRRVAERRGEEGAPDDDGVEVRHARPRSEQAESDPQQACGDGAEPDPAHAAARGPDARGHGDDAEQGRPEEAPFLQGRQRHPEGDETEDDAGDPDRPGSCDPRRHVGAFRRRPKIDLRTCQR
jgi:hypothetical protein